MSSNCDVQLDTELNIDSTAYQLIYVGSLVLMNRRAIIVETQ